MYGTDHTEENRWKMEDMAYQTADVSPSRNNKATCKLMQGQKMKRRSKGTGSFGNLVFLALAQSEKF